MSGLSLDTFLLHLFSERGEPCQNARESCEPKFRPGCAGEKIQIGQTVFGEASVRNAVVLVKLLTNENQRKRPHATVSRRFFLSLHK